MAAIIGMIWGGICLLMREQRNEALREAQQTSMNLARTSAEDVGRAIAGIDQAILFMRAAYAADPSNFDIAAWARRAGATGQTGLRFTVIDARGHVVASSLEPLQRSIDESDREHYRAHLTDRDDTLLISEPIFGRLSNRWSIHFTRRIIGLNGSFAGVLVASVDPGWLTQVYQQIDLGGGFLSLIGLDGIVRAGAPDKSRVGRVVVGTDFFKLAASRTAGTVIRHSASDSAERVMSFYRLPGYPLFVEIGLKTANVLAASEHHRNEYLIGGSGLSLLVLFVGGLLMIHKRRVLRSRRDLAAAVENIGQGLIMVDRHGRMPVINDKAIELLGIPPEMLAASKSYRDFLHWKRASGKSAGLGSMSAVPPLAGSDPQAGDESERYEHVRPDGRILEVRVRRLPDGGAVSTYTCVTERWRAEQRIRDLALHDGLTGLANRLLLEERLAQAIERATRGGSQLAILALNLDRFKVVNDSYGHATGDRVLVEVADRLRLLTGASDTVARTGGDEFVVIRTELSRPGAAPDFVQRIIRAFAEPVQVESQPVFVGTSMGVAIFPGDGATGDRLMQHAMTALDRAKADSRGGCRFFEPEMDRQLRNRRMIERDLRAGIGTDQIQLSFQPIFRAASGRVTLLEALLRWTHPVQGPIAPAEFIPIAEESGLILPLGLWALERACAYAASWPEATPVAVNLSVSQFRSGDLPARVAEVLSRTGLPASRLELEVTESLLIEDAEQALRSLRALREMGIRLALDDFGTGYSSLSYLRSYPFEKVKIDKSFVRALESDQAARAIVQAVVTMCGSLGIGVTAEGVETDRQVQILRGQGCADLQGFLLGRPIPAGEVPCYLGRITAGLRMETVGATA